MCGEAVCHISAIEVGRVILNVFGIQFYRRHVDQLAKMILENYLMRTSNSVLAYHPRYLRPTMCLHWEVVGILLSLKRGKI